VCDPATPEERDTVRASAHVEDGHAAVGPDIRVAVGHVT